MMPRVSAAEKVTVSELLGDVSGRPWSETRPYAEEFAKVVSNIVRIYLDDDSLGLPSSVVTEEKLLEIGTAVWTSMDTSLDISEVLDGEASGKVILLRRRAVDCADVKV